MKKIVSVDKFHHNIFILFLSDWWVFYLCFFEDLLNFFGSEFFYNISAQLVLDLGYKRIKLFCWIEIIDWLIDNFHEAIILDWELIVSFELSELSSHVCFD